MKYTITIEKPDMYVASVKELKGCHTQAKTLQEVLVRLYGVITLCEQGCGSTKYEGHYKCRKGNLCPECEAKLENSREAEHSCQRCKPREAEPKRCSDCKHNILPPPEECYTCFTKNNWTPQETKDETNGM